VVEVLSSRGERRAAAAAGVRGEKEVGFRSPQVGGPDLNENFIPFSLGCVWAGLKRKFSFRAREERGVARSNFGTYFRT
jgi:hypothetical protein